MKQTTDECYKKYILLIIFPLFGIILTAIKHPNQMSAFAIPPVNDTVTSTTFRYQDGFQKTLRKYTGFSSMYLDDFSTAIPGLEYTMIDDIVCGQMVPQGLCIAGKYMLITAYDNTRKFLKDTGTRASYRENCSVVYVLSNEDPANRELLTTIVLPDVNHVGGIAFDGKYAWIAKSTSKKCSALEYSTIETAVASGQENYKLSEYAANVDCGATASFLTFDNGRLWVGTYQNLLSGKGSLKSYQVVSNEDGVKLKLEDEYVIPSFANGVNFMEIDGRKCMTVVSSLGRYVNSKVHLYEIIEDKITGRNLFQYYGEYTFPPMAEEVASDGSNLYFLFESSATCYSTISLRKCSYVVDRVCAVSAESLFFWLDEDNAGRRNSQTDVYSYNYIRDCAYIHDKRLLSAA